jgi:hypothetical protein
MHPTQEPSLSAPHLWTDVGGAALRTKTRVTTSVNPAQLDDIVAVAHLAAPEAMLRACQDAKAVNNSTVGAEAHLPFGGNGRSGNGSRQSGFRILDQVPRRQAVTWDYGSGPRRAQIDIEVPEAERDFTLVDTEGQQA